MDQPPSNAFECGVILLTRTPSVLTERQPAEIDNLIAGENGTTE